MIVKISTIYNINCTKEIWNTIKNVAHILFFTCPAYSSNVLLEKRLMHITALRFYLSHSTINLTLKSCKPIGLI